MEEDTMYDTIRYDMIQSKTDCMHFHSVIKVAEAK